MNPAFVVALAIALACAGDGAAVGSVNVDTRVASIIVTPSTASIPVAGTLILRATAFNAAAGEIAGQSFDWSTSAGGIASVASSGVVTGVAAGSATITATAGGRSGSAQVTVSATPIDNIVASVTVTPVSASLTVGSSTPLNAFALNAAGQAVGGKTFTWTSSASAIASVSGAGLVTAVAAGGPTSITASTDGKSASASVMVIAPPSSSGTITVNGAQQFQTMSGWEALQEIGQVACNPAAYQSYKNGLLDRAANEVGINRIRVALRAGYEDTTDQYVRMRAGQITFDQWKTTWFRPTNDNSDPFVMAPNGFHWGYLDYVVDEIVRPLKQRLQARGDDLWFNLSFTGAGSFYLKTDPEEYAELVLAAFTHLQQKYGFIPNSFELVNEPNLGQWTPQTVAQNFLAARRRLHQAGFFPDFVGPTAASAYVALQYFDQMALIPGVTQYLNEISYHRYGGNAVDVLQDLAKRATQYRMRTAMLEHIGSGHNELHDDLTIANVSAWQQFGLAFCVPNGDDFGGLYFPIFGALGTENSPVVVTGKMTKFLRQYFRFVQLGAVRVGAATTDARFAPVAFRNKNGKYTVVVKASASGGFTVGGLPAGIYAIDYTTAQEYARALPDVTISGSQAVSTSIPLAGVLTIHAK